MTEPTDAERICAAQDRMHAAAHAMQSGVAMDLVTGSDSASPKHLRVGVNTALVEVGALAALMVEKNLITWPEYFEKMAESYEAERDRYKDTLKEKFGGNTEIDLA